MIRAPLALAALLLAAPSAFAQPAPQPGAKPGVAGESAFVAHRLALQISDASPAKQALLLNNAFNVLKSYGPDKVAIEVVAFGPGLALLHEGSPNAARIRSLATQGVTFDACMNTLATIERKTGKPYPLLPQAHKVEAGVVQLMTLQEHGYTVLRP